MLVAYLLGMQFRLKVESNDYILVLLVILSVLDLINKFAAISLRVSFYLLKYSSQAV